jgi:hypothetical protein
MLWYPDCFWRREEERLMAIAKITKQGLAAIAFSVGVLWGCVVCEHFQRESAIEERVRVMREVRRLQGPVRQVPVSDPSPLVPHRLHVTAG